MYTDVASVKSLVHAEGLALGCDPTTLGADILAANSAALTPLPDVAHPLTEALRSRGWAVR